MLKHLENCDDLIDLFQPKGEHAISFQLPKPVLEYVNIKYVEDNFRSIGITGRFPTNSLLEAYAEIQA